MYAECGVCIQDVGLRRNGPGCRVPSNSSWLEAAVDKISLCAVARYERAHVMAYLMRCHRTAVNQHRQLVATATQPRWGLAEAFGASLTLKSLT